MMKVMNCSCIDIILALACFSVELLGVLVLDPSVTSWYPCSRSPGNFLISLLNFSSWTSWFPCSSSPASWFPCSNSPVELLDFLVLTLPWNFLISLFQLSRWTSWFPCFSSPVELLDFMALALLLYFLISWFLLSCWTSWFPCSSSTVELLDFLVLAPPLNSAFRWSEVLYDPGLVPASVLSKMYLLYSSPILWSYPTKYYRFLLVQI